jgi:hypothetical protein
LLVITAIQSHSKIGVVFCFFSKFAFECSASQEERINMLILALIEKRGATSSAHYELTQTPTAAAAAASQLPAPFPDAVVDELYDANDEGVVL